MKKLYYTSLFYVVLGLLAGISYREITKARNFTGDTVLVGLHTHILVLGFIVFLLTLILAKVFNVHEAKSFNVWYVVYNIGLLITIGAMAVRGILQVNGDDISYLPHIAGLGHMILGTGMVWLLLLLRKRIS
ncbi:hypothetical protein D3C81_1105100 [compost metagenome]